MLALADLNKCTIEEIKKHIMVSYNPEGGGFVDLAGYKILIAYESVGDYGCDSSSFFLLKKARRLYEVHGSHCSCYGFEGQFDPEETTLDALKARAKKGRLFSAGGYDGAVTENQMLVKEYILKMRGRQ